MKDTNRRTTRLSQASPEPTASLDELIETLLENMLGQNYVDEYSGSDEYIGVDDIAEQIAQAINKNYIKRSDVVGMLPEKIRPNMFLGNSPIRDIELENYRAGYNNCLDDITRAIGLGVANGHYVPPTVPLKPKSRRGKP